jgi:hypothetical protein
LSETLATDVVPLKISATAIKSPEPVAGIVRLLSGVPEFDALFTTAQVGGGAPVQEGKLKEAIRVPHWPPVFGTYSVVYQNVQSSVGSIAILL